MTHSCRRHDSRSLSTPWMGRHSPLDAVMGRLCSSSQCHCYFNISLPSFRASIVLILYYSRWEHYFIRDDICFQYWFASFAVKILFRIISDFVNSLFLDSIIFVTHGSQTPSPPPIITCRFSFLFTPLAVTTLLAFWYASLHLFTLPRHRLHPRARAQKILCYRRIHACKYGNYIFDIDYLEERLTEHCFFAFWAASMLFEDCVSAQLHAFFFDVMPHREGCRDINMH